jgi:small subunit ribosomal protein S19
MFLEKNFIYKIYNRRELITSEYLNNTFSIYNGIRFFEITIVEKMLGHKLGEFSPTRKIPVHKKKKQLKKK